MGSAGARSSVEVSPSAGEGGRTPGDVTALLVELSRLVKARQFYPDQHPLLREIFERGFRAFEAETLRGGPLEVEVRQGGFRLGGEPIGRGRVDDLAQELVTRAVKLLRFDAALTPAALERFVATLAAEREKLERAGGFVKVLYAEPCPGVCVNEMDYGAALAQAGAPAAPSAELDTAHGDPLEFGEVVLEDDSTESPEEGSGDAIESVLSALGSEEKPDPAPPATAARAGAPRRGIRRRPQRSAGRAAARARHHHRRSALPGAGARDRRAQRRALRRRSCRGRLPRDPRALDPRRRQAAQQAGAGDGGGVPARARARHAPRRPDRTRVRTRPGGEPARRADPDAARRRDRAGAAAARGDGAGPRPSRPALRDPDRHGQRHHARAVRSHPERRPAARRRGRAPRRRDAERRHGARPCGPPLPRRSRSAPRGRQGPRACGIARSRRGAGRRAAQPHRGRAGPRRLLPRRRRRTARPRGAARGRHREPAGANPSSWPARRCARSAGWAGPRSCRCWCRSSRSGASSVASPCGSCSSPSWRRSNASPTRARSGRSSERLFAAIRRFARRPVRRSIGWTRKHRRASPINRSTNERFPDPARRRAATARGSRPECGALSAGTPCGPHAPAPHRLDAWRRCSGSAIGSPSASSTTSSCWTRSPSTTRRRVSRPSTPRCWPGSSRPSTS